MIDLAETYRRRHWSRDELARRVLDHWAPPKKVSPRNLSNQIAHLEKGTKTWWQKRPAAARALVEELGIELEDLGLDREVARAGTALPFHDFPAVRPFDPRSETPCEIGNEGWFDFEAATTDPRPVWIHAPAGTGWTLLGEIYRQRYGVPVQTVRTLSEIVDRNPLDWLVAQVRIPEDEADLALEKRLCERERTIICARFQPWAERHGVAVGGWGAALHGPPSGTPLWQRMGWSPVPGWQERFIRWLAGRVEGGPRFNIERLLSWLHERDPAATLFASPADVLALAGFAHEVGTRSWTESAYEKLPARWLAARITVNPASAVDSWLAVAARDSAIHAVHRWVESVAPWLQPQPRVTWYQWLPAPSAPAKALDLERHLAELETIRSPAKRAEKKQELIAAASQADSEGLFLKLEADRVLVPGRLPGDWQFQPVWLAAWLGGQHVDELVRAQEIAAWGHVAISLDRQELVDQALDRLTTKEFEEAIAVAVSGFAPGSLASVAAVESLFLAAGRRLGKGERLETSALVSLWERVVVSVDRRDDHHPPVLLTRLGPGEGDRGAQWVEACWEWNQAIPKPPVVPAAAEWLFPGWFTLLLDDLPNWFLSVTRPTERMTLLAEALIGARAEGEERPSLPHWLRAAVLVARARKGLRPHGEIVAALFRDSWDLGLGYVLARAETLAPEARAHLAGELWFFGRGSRHGSLREQALRTFINANLDEADLARWLRHNQIQRDLVPSLAPNLQRVVLRHWLEHHPEVLAAYADRVEAVDGETLELLAERLPASTAASLLWHRDPERALRFTERLVREHPEDAADWFFQGEPQHVIPLLALLERLPRSPFWAPRWLTRLLLARPADAERIHALRLRLRC